MCGQRSYDRGGLGEDNDREDAASLLLVCHQATDKCRHDGYMAWSAEGGDARAEELHRPVPRRRRGTDGPCQQGRRLQDAAGADAQRPGEARGDRAPEGVAEGVQEQAHRDPDVRIVVGQRIVQDRLQVGLHQVVGAHAHQVREAERGDLAVREGRGPRRGAAPRPPALVGGLRGLWSVDRDLVPLRRQEQQAEADQGRGADAHDEVDLRHAVPPDALRYRSHERHAAAGETHGDGAGCGTLQLGGHDADRGHDAGHVHHGHAVAQQRVARDKGEERGREAEPRVGHDQEEEGQAEHAPHAHGPAHHRGGHGKEADAAVVHGVHDRGRGNGVARLPRDRTDENRECVLGQGGRRAACREEHQATPRTGPVAFPKYLTPFLRGGDPAAAPRQDNAADRDGNNQEGGKIKEQSLVQHEASTWQVEGWGIALHRQDCLQHRDRILVRAVQRVGIVTWRSGWQVLCEVAASNATWRSGWHGMCTVSVW
eukprot:CAMPEP_0204589384 /NCGR_PEP_ID=MMETSP0661-20131031/49170_1 /ASSEMBLY_ACC=CAM_ASM_000606 /TAXON_ID=109239 /ORGANISM="Alexandrium margalefi, Strain AMGDE01CS-322" /LENGTH=483 /DNA_ID=CAMNT_0051599305 /DNA_START=247 /DNA_END=1695 /DNA_ORIENTATION=-